MTTAAVAAWPFVGRRGEQQAVGEALYDPRMQAVLITGGAGVGKTRLAEECEQLAMAQGAPTAHAIATAISAAVPLAALAPILPTRVDLPEPHRLFAATRDHLVGLARGRFVLVVDDIDLLDPTSLALLGALLSDGVLFLVATLRSDRPTPEVVEALWRGGRAFRIDLAPLSRTSSDTLLHLALRGPATAPTAQALWDASQGNALYLRELVHSACGSGALRESRGVWTLTGPLGGGAGVASLVQRRLGELDPEEREVLNLIALCSPLGLDELLAHASAEALNRLESAGLISVHVDGRRHRVTIAHPLHAAVLRESIPRLQARSILLAQVERLRAYGQRRGTDPLQLASWLVEATGTAEPSVLARAAALARYGHDMTRVEQLTTAALLAEPDATLTVLLGEVRAEMGRPAEAETLLATAVGADVETRALVRAGNLWRGLGRLDDALTCLRDAELAGGAGAAPMLSTVAAQLLAEAGRIEEATDRLADREPVVEAPRLRTLWFRARATIFWHNGRLADALAAAEAAFAGYDRIEERTGIGHPATDLLVASRCLLALGRLDDAEEVALRGQSLATRAGVASAAARFPAQLGWIALARGRPAQARTNFHEALAHSPDGAGVVEATAGLALATSMVDSDVEPTPTAPLVVDHPLLRRATAWRLVQDGKLGQAREELAQAAHRCAAAGRRTHELVLLHDIVRLGDPRGVAVRVAALANEVDGPYAAAIAAHTAAAAAHDAAGVAAAGESFAGLGADLLAAEALLAASNLWRERGDQRSAARCANRGSSLAAACEGARTPGLLRPQTTTPLSRREREVVQLAARGCTSRQIAETLVVSVRTVDNHLQSIYAKLGVSSRTGLAAALEAGLPGPADAPAAKGTTRSAPAPSPDVPSPPHAAAPTRAARTPAARRPTAQRPTAQRTHDDPR